MFKFLYNLNIDDRPAYTQMIDEIQTIKLTDDYILHIDVEHQCANIIKIFKKEEIDMSMLTEKREELVKKSNDLIASRTAEINNKVAAYKAQLEAATPIPAEVAKIQNVLKAIDEVIAYEASYSTTLTQVAETNTVETKTVETTPETFPETDTEAVKADDTTVVNTVETVETVEIPAGEVIQHVEGRPGMATIEIPERR